MKDLFGQPLYRLQGVVDFLTPLQAIARRDQQVGQGRGLFSILNLRLAMACILIGKRRTAVPQQIKAVSLSRKLGIMRQLYGPAPRRSND